jgi:hypothetical protein
MLKKIVSILMLYSAFALSLGHNLIPHHHHDFEHSEVAHHHSNGDHHHHDTDNTYDSENESEDWRHLFSGIQHVTDGLTFLTSHGSMDDVPKETERLNVREVAEVVFGNIVVEVRQNAPPDIFTTYHSNHLLSSGLRAPPVVIV